MFGEVYVVLIVSIHPSNISFLRNLCETGYGKIQAGVFSSTNLLWYITDIRKSSKESWIIFSDLKESEFDRSKINHA